MHQDIGTPAALRVTDETTKAELEEAITGHRETLRRMPAHWGDRRARLHGLIDALLVDWERAPDPRTADAQAG
jgi:hypothetical protein